MSYRYAHVADAHVAAWLKVSFGLTIERNYQYYAFVGDYIAPDEPYGTDDNSAFGAALDYAGCYDGAMFDKLNAIELGETVQ